MRDFRAFKRILSAQLADFETLPASAIIPNGLTDQILAPFVPKLKRIIFQ
jgi:hypothetical protein